jgi:alpha-1,2-mannosyltransferase
MSPAAGVRDAPEAGRPAWPRRAAERLAGLPPWAAAALGVLAWVAALAAVAPLVRGYLTGPPDQRLVDLDVYRTGGLSVLRGQPLYTMLTQPPQLLPFTYPPAAALFAVPLAVLPWPAAQLAWVPFVYVPLAVVIWYAFAPLLRRAGRLRPAAFAIVFAACAYLFPVRDEMRFGQVDLVLLALAVADCAAREPRWPRGALVGLATAIKLVPGVFVVYLWLSGRRRAALTAALVALAVTLGAWLLLPQDSVTYWTSAIFDSGRLGPNSGTSNQSLRGLLLRALPPWPPAAAGLPDVIWVVAAAAVALAGFAAVRRLARPSREPAAAGGQTGPAAAGGQTGPAAAGGQTGPAAAGGQTGPAAAGGQTSMEAVAVTALVGVLASPVSWIHHYVVVVLVIGAILADGRSPRRVALAAGTVVYFALTIPWWGQSLLGQRDVPVLVARVVQDGFGLAALVLIGVLARLRAAARRVPADQSGRPSLGRPTWPA